MVFLPAVLLAGSRTQHNFGTAHRVYGNELRIRLPEPAISRLSNLHGEYL